jgi:hypothetical protein
MRPTPCLSFWRKKITFHQHEKSKIFFLYQNERHERKLKMKIVADPVYFLKLAKLVLDNCGPCIWDALDASLEQNDCQTQKFIRTLSTEGEFSDSEMNEFIEWLQECLYAIESEKGIQYGEEEAGYADLVALVSA